MREISPPDATSINGFGSSPLLVETKIRFRHSRAEIIQHVFSQHSHIILVKNCRDDSLRFQFPFERELFLKTPFTIPNSFQ